MGLTVEVLETILKDLSLKHKDDMVIIQGCKEQGFVKRTTLDLNLCSNPECKSCRQFDEQIKKIMKNYERF